MSKTIHAVMTAIRASRASETCGRDDAPTAEGVTVTSSCACNGFTLLELRLVSTVPVASGVEYRTEHRVGSDDGLGHVLIIWTPACLWRVIEIPQERQPYNVPFQHIVERLDGEIRLFLKRVVVRELQAFRDAFQPFGRGPTELGHAQLLVAARQFNLVGVSLQGATEAPAMVRIVERSPELRRRIVRDVIPRDAGADVVAVVMRPDAIGDIEQPRLDHLIHI